MMNIKYYTIICATMAALISCSDTSKIDDNSVLNPNGDKEEINDKTNPSDTTPILTTFEEATDYTLGLSIPFTLIAKHSIGKWSMFMRHPSYEELEVIRSQIVYPAIIDTANNDEFYYHDADLEIDTTNSSNPTLIGGQSYNSEFYLFLGVDKDDKVFCDYFRTIPATEKLDSLVYGYGAFFNHEQSLELLKSIEPELVKDSSKKLAWCTSTYTKYEIYSTKTNKNILIERTSQLD